MLSQCDLSPKFRVFNISQCRSFHFVFLFLDSISQELLFACLLTIMLSSLIDRAESLVAFVELRKHMRLVLEFLEFLVVIVKYCVVIINRFSFRFKSLLFEFFKRLYIWHDF